MVRNFESPDECDPCLTSDSSTNWTGTSEQRSSPKPRSPVLFYVDKANLCIFLLFLLLLILITGAVAFVIGHWTALLRKPDPIFAKKENKSGDSTNRLLIDSWNRQSNRKRNETPITRLPSSLVPSHYDVSLNVTSFESEIVSGDIAIHLNCVESTNNVTFHVGSTVILNAFNVTNARTGKNLPWRTFSNFSRKGIFIIQMRDRLKIGDSYRLQIKFIAKICHLKSGVFCYRAKSPTNEKFKNPPIAFTTKFEPTAARSLLPCWDEPRFKAVFNLSVIHQPDITVLSNTDIYQKVMKSQGHYTISYFRPTPPMTTYVFAVVLGPFASIENRSKRGIRIAVWTLPEDSLKSAFALNVATKMFDEIEDYFQVQYPLKKLDFVASRNYPVGAMENWGLLVFHYESLLLEPSNADAEGSGFLSELAEPQTAVLLQKYKITKVIIHELIHQWFGNLVTMAWWSDIWLNEGFTTFYADHFLRKTFPRLTDYESKIRLGETWKRQATDFQRLALVRKFESEEQITRSFDQWSLYAKGSICTGVMWELLGEEALRLRLIDYLKNNAYTSVTRQNLWGYLGNTTLQSLKKIGAGKVLETWVINPGFPEIAIERDFATGALFTDISVADSAQHRVHINNYIGLNINHTWIVPFSYCVEGETSNVKRAWIGTRSFSLQDAGLKNSQWLLVNPNFQFPYRVNYDLDNWQLLISQLHQNFSAIPKNSRIQLLLDGDHFLKESSNFLLYFKLLGYLKSETDSSILSVGVDSLALLLDSLKSSPAFPLLLLYYRSSINQMVNGLLKDAAIWHFESQRLNQLYTLACVINHKLCEQKQEVFATQRPNNEVEFIARCYHLARNATTTDREIMYHTLGAGTRDPVPFLRLAACARDRLLNEKVTEILIENQNAGHMISVISADALLYNEDLRTLLWNTLSTIDGQQKQGMLQRKFLAALFLASARSSRELNVVSKVIPGLSKEKNRLRSRLRWLENRVTPALEQWLLRELNL